MLPKLRCFKPSKVYRDHRIIFPNGCLGLDPAAISSHTEIKIEKPVVLIATQQENPLKITLIHTHICLSLPYTKKHLGRGLDHLSWGSSINYDIQQRNQHPLIISLVCCALSPYSSHRCTVSIPILWPFPFCSVRNSAM